MRELIALRTHDVDRLPVKALRKNEAVRIFAPDVSRLAAGRFPRRLVARLRLLATRIIRIEISWDLSSRRMPL
jgi:hypothetical protein